MDIDGLLFSTHGREATASRARLLA